MANNSADFQTPPSIDERLSNFERTLAELLAGQRQILSTFEFRMESLEAGQESLKSEVSSLKSEVLSLKSTQESLRIEIKDLNEEMKQHYVDLRNRIELNNDKFSLIQRELNQIARDIRNPAFALDTR